MAIGLERTIANILLGTNIPLLPSGNIRLGGGWRVNLLRFSNWKGIGYLFAKFPFGILSFALAVLTLSLPLSLLISPLAILFGTSNVSIMGWQVTSSPAAIVAFAIGLMITPVLLFINNRLMDIWRVFTVAMLTPARRETAQLDKAKRDFAYDNRRRVVVPDHTTVEDRYQDPDDYEKAKRHISDLLEDDAQDSNTYEKPKRKTLAELLAETDDDFS